MKTALILGATGQDGAYLSRLLLSKGYRVVGTSRDARSTRSTNLERLGIADDLELLSLVPSDYDSVHQALATTRPDEVYALAGQSSVGLSFELPKETFESIATATWNLLEAARTRGEPVRIYCAGSSECFGERQEPATEESPFYPMSPYAAAKASAFWAVANYREAYGIHACSAILYNHESDLRPERFVTQKIVATACRIARGSNERLGLGNIRIARDWGWAPEFVEAMWAMLQQPEPEDFILATGQTYTLEEFVAAVFAVLKLDWREHVDNRDDLLRPSDILVSRADPRKAERVLGWKAAKAMPEVAASMVQARLKAMDDGIVC